MLAHDDDGQRIQAVDFAWKEVSEAIDDSETTDSLEMAREDGARRAFEWLLTYLLVPRELQRRDFQKALQDIGFRAALLGFSERHHTTHGVFESLRDLARRANRDEKSARRVAARLQKSMKNTSKRAAKGALMPAARE